MRIIIFYCIIIFFYSCNNKPKNVPFPKYPEGISKDTLKPSLKPSAVSKLSFQEINTDSLFTITKTKPAIPDTIPFYDNTSIAKNNNIRTLKSPDVFSDSTSELAYTTETYFASKPRSYFSNSIDYPVKSDTTFKTTYSFFPPPPGLISWADPEIKCFLQDNKGRLWIGSKSALLLYDGIHTYVYDNWTGLPMHNGEINCLLESKDGTIWIGCQGGGLISFDYPKNLFTQYKFAENTHSSNGEQIGAPIKSFLLQYINTISETDDGAIWFGNDQTGLVEFNVKEKKIKQHILKGSNNLSVKKIVSLKDNSIAIASGSLYIYKAGTKQYLQYGDSQNFPGGISSLSIQSDTNLLIATNDSGFLNLNLKSFALKQYTIKEGLFSNTVLDVSFTNSGKIILANGNAGLVVFDPEENYFERFGTAEGIDAFVYCVFSTNDDKIWTGTNDGLFITDLNNDISNYNSPMVDTSTYYKLFYLNYSKKRMNDGNIWMGTDKHGVLVFDSKSRKILNYSTKHGLIGNSIDAIMQNTNGSIWISNASHLEEGKIYEGGGISIYDTVTKTFTNYKNNSFYGGKLTQSKDGKVWITDYKKLIVYDPTTNKFFYPVMDGVILDGPIHNIYEGSNGWLWLENSNSIVDYINIIDLKKREVSTFPKKDLHFLRKAEVVNFEYMHANLNSTYSGIDSSGNIYQDFYDFGNNIKFPITNEFSSSEIDNNARIWFGSLKYKIPKTSDTSRAKVFFTAIEVMDHSITWHTKKMSLETRADLDTIWEGYKDTFFITSSIPADTGWLSTSGITYDGVDGIFNMPTNLILPYDTNDIGFYFSQGGRYDFNSRKYCYFLEGLDRGWRMLSGTNKLQFRNLPSGNYNLKIAVLGNNGLWSIPSEFTFEIAPPWWQTAWFRITVLISIACLIGFYIKMREKKLISEKHKLEETVKERTSEVVHQKTVIEEKQKEILDSITYAKRLQQAILPPLSFINTHLFQNFILYKPKDIVAGDFYWMEVKNDIIFIAAADCTGHGVPGAIVSMVCCSALNRTVNEFEITETGKILDKTRELVLETFAKSENDVKDGMDISLCTINTKTKEVYWSGANNPLLYFSNNVMNELLSDKQPIGKTDHEKSFTTHKLQINKGDTLFLFTDGYADQFGGPKGKKIMYKKFKELLLSIIVLPLPQQSEILNKNFENWRGDLEQVDDVCIIGFRIG